MKFCVLLFDGERLYGVFGPFVSKEKADAWRSKDSEETDLRRVVVPLYKPE